MAETHNKYVNESRENKNQRPSWQERIEVMEVIDGLDGIVDYTNDGREDEARHEYRKAQFYLSDSVLKEKLKKIDEYVGNSKYAPQVTKVVTEVLGEYRKKIKDKELVEEAEEKFEKLSKEARKELESK